MATVVQTGFAVQARGLAKSYKAGDQDLPVLRGVDLDIRQGEFVSIMGPSGSGKSTLLNLIGLLDVPTAGRIRLLEQPVHKLGSNGRALARRKNLGFVFQSFNLMPRLNALHNVMLPMAIAGVPSRERKKRALRLLARVGLADRTRHRPNELSGGQKQRVAIARALALDPPILLADEPTGNLDSATSRDVMRLFQQLNAAGKTVIQVTHDPEMAAYSGRIIHFRDGVVAKQEWLQGRSLAPTLAANIASSTPAAPSGPMPPIPQWKPVSAPASVPSSRTPTRSRSPPTPRGGR